jgi:hypothetical protein
MFCFILLPPFGNRWSLQRSLEKVADKQDQPGDYGKAQDACQDELHVLGHDVWGFEVARSFV